MGQLFSTLLLTLVATVTIQAIRVIDDASLLVWLSTVTHVFPAAYIANWFYEIHGIAHGKWWTKQEN